MGGAFRGFHGSRICYGLPDCSPSCTDPTGLPAVEDFYSQAFNAIGSLLGMTTAVAGPFCWRDSHPLERQLESLHQISAPHAAFALWVGARPSDLVVSRPHHVYCCYGPVTRNLPKGDLVDGLQDLGDFGHPRHPAIRTTGLLTLALAGLPPAEHTSLSLVATPQPDIGFGCASEDISITSSGVTTCCDPILGTSNRRVFSRPKPGLMLMCQAASCAQSDPPFSRARERIR